VPRLVGGVVHSDVQIFRNNRDRVVPAEAGIWPFLRLHGLQLTAVAKITQQTDFQGIIPSPAQGLFFENKGCQRLKFLPEKYDIYLEAREIQVKRRNDS
jgi:hypothetical protein